MKTVRRPPYPKWNPGYFPCSSLTPLPLSSRRPSVSFGGFGLRVDGFTLAIRGQSPCGESPADRGHRSQSFSLVTTDPVGVHACSEVLHGDAAKTSSGVQSPEDTRTRWRFLGRDDLVLIAHY